MSEIKDAKLKIGVIGVGNAGNQAANLAYNQDYRTLIINSSTKDIDNSLVNAKIPTFILLDKDGMARGCGKERDFGKYLMSYNAQNFVESEKFLTFSQGLDIIIITGSTAGGTGSGAVPYLADMLNRYLDNVTVIVNAIIPKLDEAIGAQINTIGFMKDIESYRNNDSELPYMITDLNVYANLPNEQGYLAAAKSIVETMNIIRGDYFYTSPYGMIDERDTEKIVSQPGYMCMSHINNISRDALDEGSIQELMIKSINDGISVTPQRDLIVKQIGVAISMPESFNEEAKTGNYSTITEMYGQPINTFENYYVSDNPNGEAVIMLSGMSFPYDRFNSAAKKINEHTEYLKKSHAAGTKLIEESEKLTDGIFSNLKKGKIYGSSSEADAKKKNFDFGKPCDF